MQYFSNLIGSRECNLSEIALSKSEITIRTFKKLKVKTRIKVIMQTLGRRTQPCSVFYTFIFSGLHYILRIVTRKFQNKNKNKHRKRKCIIYLQCIMIITIMDRFSNAIDDDIEFFKEASSSKNTKKSTRTWMSIFEKWAVVRGVNPNIEQHIPEELNKILEKFYAEVRKSDGKQYEPSCLRILMSGLDRLVYLTVSFLFQDYRVTVSSLD